MLIFSKVQTTVRICQLRVNNFDSLLESTKVLVGRSLPTPAGITVLIIFCVVLDPLGSVMCPPKGSGTKSGLSLGVGSIL